MDVVIQTKFSVGDIVYAFYNGLSKYEIMDISVSRESLYDKKSNDEIYYLCHKMIGNEKSDIANRFSESDLLTKKDMKAILESALKND